MASSSPYRHDAALLLVVLVWGINFPVLKAALTAMHPHVINIFRFLVSAGVLGTLYAARSDTWDAGFFAPLRTHARQIITLGLLGYVAYQISFIVGVDHTTAGSAALIMASAPLWTAMLSRIAGYERLGYTAWTGLVVSLIGTGLVIAAGADTALSGSLFGNLLMLLAAVLWGAYTAFNKTVVHDVSPTGATFFGILIALPFLVGIGAPYLDTVTWSAVDAWVWGAIVFSGGLSTGIAFIIWNTAVKNVGASNTAVYSNLVPFVALLGGVVVLGEAVTWSQGAGGVLIIGGLVVMRREQRQRAHILDDVAEEGVSGLPTER
jgi:drug/metabolite transporter (DMT)-like permease